jgi:hypothetical protein
MGPDNEGHVRYPLYNASKNETLKNRGKRENLMGNPPSKYNASKKGRKAVAKQLCPSFQDDRAGSGTFA